MVWALCSGEVLSVQGRGLCSGGLSPGRGSLFRGSLSREGVSVWGSMSREGDLCLQGVFVQEVSVWVVSVYSCFVQGGYLVVFVQEVSVWVVCPQGSLCRRYLGVSVQGRGSLSRGCLSRLGGLCPGEGSLFRGGGLCPGKWVSVQECSLSNRWVLCLGEGVSI